MKRMIIILLLIFVPNVYAADSTPSADIRSKLEALKKEIASKAAKLKQEIDRKLQNRAYVGKVTTISPQSVTLATRSGPKIVSLNQDTEFASNVRPKKTFAQKNILEDDYLGALGDIDEQGVLTARKIILLPVNNPQPKTYLWGQIVSISDKLATLKDKEFKSIAVSLPVSKIKTNDFVILTGNYNENEIFEAEFVYIIPHAGIIKPKKEATSSAKTASPSVTPAAKKK